MIKRFLFLNVACALLLIFCDLSLTAEPISGNLLLEIGLEPQSLSEGGASKIVSVIVDAEMTLHLSLSVSGLDLTNWTHLSLNGVEYEALILTLRASSPLVVRNITIFAPNILQVAGDLLWTVALAAPDPGGLTGLALRLFIHKLAPPLELSNLLGSVLDKALVFRKDIFELELTTGSLISRLSILLANVSAETTPDFRAGLVMSLAGKTPSGLYLESITYLGARQGFSCFGECKLFERWQEGYAADVFGFQQEALIARNLQIGGIANDVELVIDLANVLTRPFSKFDWQLKGKFFETLGFVQRFRFDLGPTLGQALIQSQLEYAQTQLSIELIDNDTSTIDFPIRQLTLAMTLGEFHFRDILLLQATGGLVHAIILETNLEFFSFSAQTIFLGSLFSDFYSERIEALYRFGFIEFKMNVLVRRDSLLYFGVGLGWHF